MSGYLANMRVQTAELADRGLPFAMIGESLVELIAPVGDLIEKTYPNDHLRALRALRAVEASHGGLTYEGHRFVFRLRAAA